MALTLGGIARQTGPDATAADEPSAANLSDLVENSLAALKTLRDEIRVDLNLAGKEIRDRWRRLEAQLRAAELRARAPQRDGGRNLAVLLEDAKALRAHLRSKPVSRREVRR